MAFTSPLEQLLAQRTAQLQAPNVGGPLGPILSAPTPTGPQLSVADLIAGAAKSRTQLMPAPQVPAIAMDPTNAAGAAQGTGQGGDPMAAIMAALSGGQGGPMASPRPDNLAAATGTPAYPMQSNPGATGELAMPAWITNLFGGSDAPAANVPLTDAAAKATAPVAAVGAADQTAAPAIPAQQQAAPAVPASKATTPATPTGEGSPEVSPIGTKVYEAISNSLPELPKEETSAIMKVFENNDLFKTMIAMGAALDSGRSYGEAAAMGAQAFMGSQNERAQQAAQNKKDQMAQAQQTFENKLEVAKLGKDTDKNAAQAELARARAEAAKAGIAVTKEQVNLVRAQTQKNLAQAAKAGREEGKSGLAPKDYAKLMLDVQQDMELNGTVPDDSPVTDESRIRVNLALPEEMRQYAPVPSTVKEEVKALAEKTALAPEDKTRLERLKLLYGPVI